MKAVDTALVRHDVTHPVRWHVFSRWAECMERILPGKKNLDHARTAASDGSKCGRCCVGVAVAPKADDRRLASLVHSIFDPASVSAKAWLALVLARTRSS